MRVTLNNIVLAMDLSMSSPGFAVMAISDGQPIVLETSFVKTNAKKSHGYRLGEISEEMDRYLTDYQPQHIVREKGFLRFAVATQVVSKTVGISDLYAYMRLEKDVVEIPPTAVKRMLTGMGHASKEEVASAVFRILQIDNTDEYYRINRKGERILLDDMTDSLAVGLAYMGAEGLVD